MTSEIRSACVPKSAKYKYLLIGSTEAYSGKSATVLGLSHLLQQKGLDLAYGKPLGTCLSKSSGTVIEQDVQLITAILNLPENRVAPTLVALNEISVQKRLCNEDTTDYRQSLTQKYLQMSVGDLVLLEGPGNLEEGSLYNLSLPQIAEAIDAAVLLVTRYQSLLSIESVLSAKQRLGKRLIGFVLNDVPA